MLAADVFRDAADLLLLEHRMAWRWQMGRPVCPLRPPARNSTSMLGCRFKSRS